MSPDEQEAFSRKYSDDIIILLPLKNGKIAVFNAARELCAVLSNLYEYDDYGCVMKDILGGWRPPKEPEPFSGFTLEDIGL